LWAHTFGAVHLDVEFLKKSAEINPFALEFKCEHEDFVGNMELAVAVLGGKYGYLAAQDCMHPLNRLAPAGEAGVGFSLQVAEHIRLKLCLHDAFVEHVLGSIDFSATEPSNLAFSGISGTLY